MVPWQRGNARFCKNRLGRFDSDRDFQYNYYNGGDHPYFAYAQDGWGRGVGHRYASFDEAKDNLDRLHKKL